MPLGKKSTWACQWCLFLPVCATHKYEKLSLSPRSTIVGDLRPWKYLTLNPNSVGLNFVKSWTNPVQKIPNLEAYLVTLCLCLLSIPLAFIFINYWALVCMFIGSFAFLSLVIILLVEYNILTIYRCYKIYNRDDVYSKFLESAWMGEPSERSQ